MPEYKKLTHSTASVDSTITEVANAKTGASGESFQTLKARLDDEHNSISEKTRNLFSLDGLLIGYNASGSSGFQTRAISQAIPKTESSITISTKALPANLKYQIVGYTDSDFGGSSSITSDWITSSGQATTTSADKSYIRILFGSVNNQALSAQDFTGLKMQVENGATATEYIPQVTATDYTARESVEEASDEFDDKLSDISETTKNLFSLDCVTIGINQAGQANAKTALTASFQKIGTAITISTKTLPANLQYRVIGYTDAEYGGAVNISGDPVTDVTHVTTVSTKDYIRVVFSLRDNVDISAQDLNGLEMMIEDGAAATTYMPKITAFDYIARNTQAAVGSAPEHVKVMTYNIGAYTYGQGGTIDESTVVPQCRTFFNNENCDIIGLQEATTSLGTHTADESIYDYLYPSKVNATNRTAIKSRYTLTDTGSGAFEASSRIYVYGTAYINGKEIFVMCVHLSPNSVRTRTEEYAELFDILEDHESFIVFGDFNESKSEAQSRFDAVIAEGYHTANGDYLGLINTYGESTQYLDNIITSADITIAKTYVPDVYASMCSDHLPLICDLIIYP